MHAVLLIDLERYINQTDSHNSWKPVANNA